MAQHSSVGSAPSGWVTRSSTPTSPPTGPGLRQTSFFEHEVRHYDSRYTEELTARLSDLTLPVRLLWGAQDRWQPLSYGHRLASDIRGRS